MQLRNADQELPDGGRQAGVCQGCVPTTSVSQEAREGSLRVAELLVKAVDHIHADPTINTRDCYKRGDIIGVAPNGWPWGAKELKAPAEGGKFVVIKITDVTRQQVINWVRNHWGTEIDGIDWITTLDNVVRRRRVRINVAALPANVRNTLNNTGQFTTTWAAVRQFVHNKLNNETAADSPIE
jgi:hypothetical protein